VADAAGVAGGLWSFDDLEQRVRPADEFRSGSSESHRTARRAAWHRAVERAMPARLQAADAEAGQAAETSDV
jgi:glycerol kinase